MNRVAAGAVLALLCLAAIGGTPAAGQSVSRVYTQFDTDKCRHTQRISIANSARGRRLPLLIRPKRNVLTVTTGNVIFAVPTPPAQARPLSSVSLKTKPQ